MNSIIAPLLKAQCITKSFEMKGGRLEILKGIDLEVAEGESLCVLGSSGAGKSTLLHILGTLDRPTLGKLFYKGQEITKNTDAELASFRNKSMGFVFQFHHLLSEFTALENIYMPCLIAGMSKKDSEEKAKILMEKLGIYERAKHFPSELSGGEKQRVAIARALVQEPEVLLADEPTGSLDSYNANLISDLFFSLKEQLGLTMIIVTHNRAFSGKFQRVLSIRDGNWEKQA